MKTREAEDCGTAKVAGFGAPDARAVDVAAQA